MKTTLELPESLVKEENGDKLPVGVLTRHPITGFPLIICPRKPSADEELTPDRIAELLLEQEVEWHLAACGYRIPN